MDLMLIFNWRIMKYYRIYAFVVAITFASSCTEEALDTSDPNQITTDNFWVTLSDAEAGIYGVYNSLQRNGLYGQNLFRMECASDNGFNMWDFEGYLDISEGTHVINNGPITQLWTSSYRTIDRANNVLANVPGMDINEDAKNSIIGEALTLRALCYLNLTTLYGDVPLFLIPIQLIDMNTASTSIDVIRTEMINNLQQAVDLLPDDNPGRIEKGAAIALLGKTYLYNKEFDLAATTLARLIGGKYEIDLDYATLFSVAGETSREIIFAVKFSALPGQGNGGWSEGHAGTRVLPNFVDEFEMTDGMSIDDSPLYDPQNPLENRDPRLDVTVLSEGEPVSGGNIFRAIDSPTGYGYNKYVIPELNTNLPQDFYVIRYADVLLMYAEALNESSGPSQAIYDAVNEVRGRVSMPPIATGQTQDELRETIRHERRVELGFEGQRMFDLFRWGITKDRFENGVKFHTRTFIEPKHLRFPIPLNEIDNNQGIDQNPGWF